MCYIGGKPIQAAEIKWLSSCSSGGSDQSEVSGPREKISPHGRNLFLAFTGHMRMVRSKVLGAELHRGQVSSGDSVHQEGCAER